MLEWYLVDVYLYINSTIVDNWDLGGAISLNIIGMGRFIVAKYCYEMHEQVDVIVIVQRLV